MLISNRMIWIAALGLCWLPACGSFAGTGQAPSASLGPAPLMVSPLPSASATLLVPGTAGFAASATPSWTASPQAESSAEVTTGASVDDRPPPAASLNPLTGLPATEPALLERRPLVIKISNYPRDIRPQYGLNEADVVFEYYIEWGYTRFIGIFYGNDAAQIGPVRSGRYFDEHITRMYQAYYVFNYADPREYTYFLGGDLQEFMIVPGYGSCPPFFQHRVSPRIADVRHYETYFDSTRFHECLARGSDDNSRPDLNSTFFTDDAPASGTPVERLFTYYSRCDYNYWQYDGATATYLRFQEANASTDLRYINNCVDDPRKHTPLMDSVTGEQVFADNLVVLYVSHTFANAGEQGDEIYHIDLIDSGRAYVFRDGLGLPARWVRTDIDQPLVITTLGGDPLGLRPGRTFFQVLGETSEEWSDGTDWHFDFHTP